MKKIYIVILVVFTVLNVNAQWQQLGNIPINCLTINGTKMYAGTPQNNGIFYTSNNGDTWTYANYVGGYGWPINIHSIIINGSKIIAGTEYRLVFSSDLYGNNWAHPYYAGMVNDAEVYSLAMSGSNIWAGTQYGVYLSSDYGNTWNLSYGMPGGSYVYSLVKTGAKIFAGTNYGMFLSNDNGNNWTAVNSGLPPSGSATISSIAISGTKIFIGTLSQGIFFSNDNGNNWTEVNTGLTNNNISSLVISGTRIFAGSFSGNVFLSQNNGSNWIPFNTGLTVINVNALAINGTYIFAGTNIGTWRRPLVEVTADLDETNLDDTEINIYPNPLTTQTTISFVEEQRNSTIKIRDVFGKEIKTISITGKELEIEKGEMKAGIYFVQVIDVNKNVVNKKIIVQ